jgi:transposase
MEAELKRLQRAIDDHIDRHPELKRDMALLTSIPAVGVRVGNNLLAIIHAHRFESAEQVAAYLGLVPVERQSGSSVLGRAKLSKAGPARVRAVLYMAAIVATQYNPHIKALYERLLARGKSRMSALGAAMRKLVHLCFGVIKTQLPYQPNYAKSFDC